MTDDAEYAETVKYLTEVHPFFLRVEGLVQEAGEVTRRRQLMTNSGRARVLDVSERMSEALRDFETRLSPPKRLSAFNEQIHGAIKDYEWWVHILVSISEGPDVAEPERDAKVVLADEALRLAEESGNKAIQEMFRLAGQSMS